MSVGTLLEAHEKPPSETRRAKAKVSRRLLAAAWTLAAIYLLTGVWKILDFRYSVQSLEKTAFLDVSTARVLTGSFVAVEFVLALALVFTIALTWASLGSLFFSAAAALVHAYVLWAGEVVPCGCVGRVLQAVQTWEHHVLLGLSVVMFLLSALLYLSLPPRARPSASADPVAT